MNLKKLFASTLSVLMLATMVPTSAFGATYSDELQEAYDYAYGVGSTTMDSIDNANVYGQLIRSHMAKMLSAWAKDVLGLTPDTSKTCEFTDIENQTQEMQDYIVESCQLGLMGVGISEFRPNDKVTRAEFGTVLSRALRGDKYNGGTPYYADHLAALEEAGIMTNISNPNMFEVRGYVRLMMQRADDKGVATPATCKDPMVQIACALNSEDDACPVECRDTEEEEDIVKDGTLDVSLNSDSPNNGSSIPKVGIATFASIDLEADETIKINSFDIEKVGLGDRTTIKKVWFENNGVRVSSKATLGSDSKANVSFSPAFEVKDNETLELVVELSGSSSAEEFAFKFVDADTTAEDVNLDVTTPTLKTATYTVATMNFVKQGVDTTYNAGDNTNLELGKFTLENVNNDERDVTFKAITFRNNGDGDMEANLENLALYQNGTKISDDYTINSKDITFVVDSLKLTANQTQTYYIRGDAKGVDKAAGDTYKFTLRFQEDLNAVEKTTLFRTTVKINSATFASTDLATYTVKGGNITLTKDTTLASTNTVSPATNGVVVLKGKIDVKEPVRFEDLTITGTLGSLVSKVTLKIGSATATYTPTATGAQSMTFYGTWNVDKSSTVQILVDVKSTATDGTITFDPLTVDKFSIVEYVSNSYSAKNEGVGSISAASITVKGTTVTASRTDGLANRNVVQGSNNLTLFEGKLTSTTSIETTVDAFVFSGNNTTFNSLLSTTLYVNGNPVKSANFTNGKITFSSLSVKVKQGTEATIKLVGNLTTSTALANQSLTLTWNGFSAYDENSKTVTISDVSAAAITVKDAGTVELANNSSAAQKSLYTAGSQNVELGKIDVKAQDDTVKLTDLYLENDGTLDLANRVNSPKLYYVDGTTETLIANGSLVGTTLVFENLDSANFKVNAATTKTLVVRANLNTVLNTGDLSNKTLILDLEDGGYTAAKAGTVNGARFVSDSNGNTITTVTENYTANEHTVVRGAPELASTATTATNSRLMNFTTKAISNEIKVKRFVSTMSNVESGAALTVTVYKDSVSSANKVAEGTGTVGSTNSITINLDSSVAAGYSISSNQTANFIVEVVGYSPKTNNGYAYTREFKITDVVYDDVFQNGTLTVSSINAFVNVGILPLVSTYQP